MIYEMDISGAQAMSGDSFGLASCNASAKIQSGMFPVVLAC